VIFMSCSLITVSLQSYISSDNRNPVYNSIRVSVDNFKGIATDVSNVRVRDLFVMCWMLRCGLAGVVWCGVVSLCRLKH
jgi:hypothetical protein